MVSLTKGVEAAQTNLDGTNLQDKTFSSRASSPKSAVEGFGSLTTNGSGVGTAKVPHPFAYPPAHLFWFTPGNTNAVLHPGTAPWIDREKGTTWGLMDNFTFTVTPNASTCTITVQGIANIKYSYYYLIFEKPVLR